VFTEIAEERNARCRSVASWGWDEYAKNHLAIWEDLIERRSRQSDLATQDESAVQEVARIIAAVPAVPETILQKCGRIFLREGIFQFVSRQITQWIDRCRQTRGKKTEDD
ncbi:MAG: hypothetical protein IID45_14515, partial [Planctomycetes bacterium]|nr:hypothetical protein [Planctomycetota bacterium]